MGTQMQRKVAGALNAGLLKSRHGGVGRVFNLKISPLSLAITDSMFDRQNTARVQQEISLHAQGMHYEDYRVQLDNAIAQGALL